MKNLKYYMMVLLGGAMYGMMSSFVKLSYSRGYNAAELSFWQAFLSAIILSLCALFTYRRTVAGRLSGRGFLSLLPVGIAIGMTNYLYYLSVSFIPASFAIILLMQFTWLSLIIERIFFHRHVSAIEWFTVIFIFVGTIFASKILELHFQSVSLKGVLLALASSFTYAIYIVANGRVGIAVRWQSKSAVIMMGSSLSILLTAAPTVLSFGYWNNEFLLWALFLSVVGTTIPTALFAVSISKISAGVSAILMSVELPVAILCARLVLYEHITVLQIVGVAIMLASISVLNFYKLSKMN